MTRVSCRAEVSRQATFEFTFSLTTPPVNSGRSPHVSRASSLSIEKIRLPHSGTPNSFPDCPLTTAVISMDWPWSMVARSTSRCSVRPMPLMVGAMTMLPVVHSSTSSAEHQSQSGSRCLTHRADTTANFGYLSLAEVLCARLIPKPVNAKRFRFLPVSHEYFCSLGTSRSSDFRKYERPFSTVCPARKQTCRENAECGLSIPTLAESSDLWASKAQSPNSLRSRCFPACTGLARGAGRGSNK